MPSPTYLLLESIMNLEVVTGVAYLGDVIGDITDQGQNGYSAHEKPPIRSMGSQ